MSNVEMLTPQNSAIALIDYQPAMYQGVQSHDRLLTFNNIQVLAKAAKLFGIPTVISTIAKDSFSGPFMPEITNLFPQHVVIDRTAMNGWLDANFRKAIHDTKRKKLVLAGLWTEACVMFPTLDMLKEGFEVYIPPMPAAMFRWRHTIVPWTEPSRPARSLSPPSSTYLSCSRMGAHRDLRRRHGDPAGAFTVRHSGALLQVGARRTCLRGRTEGSRITDTPCSQLSAGD